MPTQHKAPTLVLELLRQASYIARPTTDMADSAYVSGINL